VGYPPSHNHVFNNPVLHVLIRLAGFMPALRVSPKRTCHLHFNYIRHGLTGQQRKYILMRFIIECPVCKYIQPGIDAY